MTRPPRLARAIASAILACLGFWPVPTAARPAAEVRGLWVVRTALTTEAGIRTMVEAAARAGLTDLFVQVRGRGDAYYSSRLEPRADALARTPRTFDPLAVVLREAQSRGLVVHAWVNVNLVADASRVPTAGAHVAARHPDWLMLPRDLAAALGDTKPGTPQYVAKLAAWTRERASTVEGLYTSPAHDANVEHVLDVVDDLVTHYRLAGVHLDFIRYPNGAFDYSRAALRAFSGEVGRSLPRATRDALKRQARTDRFVWVDRYPAAWDAFRRARVTALVRRLRARVAARRPGIQVSAAVAPELDTAVGPRGQDWPAWLAQRLVDFVCPMIYTTSTETFRAQLAAAREAAGSRPVLAGIGAYRLSSEQTLRHVAAARDGGAGGFVLFSYDSLTAGDAAAAQLDVVGRGLAGR